MKNNRAILAGITAGAISLGAASALVLPISAHAQSAPTERCYTTGGGGLQVCRSTIEPEGVFFSPPRCELAYNVQPMKLPDGKVYTIYHSEPKKVEETCAAGGVQIGDGLRGGFQPGPLALDMSPVRPWVLWGSTDDPPSTLYSRLAGSGATLLSQVGGPANPMLVAGRHAAGDNYYYLHFVMAVKSPAGDNPTQVRHFLGIARTLDFVNWDLRTHVNGAPAWVRFDTPTTNPPQVTNRANEVADTQGQLIAGRCASTTGASQGLIGSISYVGDRYYYVYTDISAGQDCNAERPEMTLYVREALDITQVGSWGPAQVVKTGLPYGTIVRAAKAQGQDKWAVSYNCYSNTGPSQTVIQDLCLQYTGALSMQGAQGVAGLTFFDDPPSTQFPRSQYHLAIRIGGEPNGPAREQHDWMTDRDGNLASPDAYPTQGGLLTFADKTARPTSADRSIGEPYGVPVYWATWQVRAVN